MPYICWCLVVNQKKTNICIHDTRLFKQRDHVMFIAVVSYQYNIKSPRESILQWLKRWEFFNADSQGIETARGHMFVSFNVYCYLLSSLIQIQRRLLVQNSSCCLYLANNDMLTTWPAFVLCFFTVDMSVIELLP